MNYNDLLREMKRNSAAVPEASRDGSSPLRLATRDFASFLIGALDEVAIYPRVLSAEEIAEKPNARAHALAWAMRRRTSCAVAAISGSANHTRFCVSSLTT
jgi:hypothetical protein